MLTPGHREKKCSANKLLGSYSSARELSFPWSSRPTCHCVMPPRRVRTKKSQEPQPTLLSGFLRLSPTHTQLWVAVPEGARARPLSAGLEPAAAPSQDLYRLGCFPGPRGILHQTPGAKEAQTHSLGIKFIKLL